VELSLTGVPGRRVVMTSAELLTAEPLGLALRLEHCLAGIETVRQDALAGIAGADAEAHQAAARVDAPFDHAARLAGLRQRHDEIQSALMPAEDPSPASPDAADADQAARSASAASPRRSSALDDAPLHRPTGDEALGIRPTALPADTGAPTSRP
jgi:hypothetical protein